MLTSANSFSMSIDQLSNGAGVDNTVTGNLLTNADQTITNLRLFNANGGADAFFNNFTIAAVPEASGLAFGGLIIVIFGINYCFFGIYRRRWESRGNSLPPHLADALVDFFRVNLTLSFEEDANDSETI